eukprot:1187947-Prymnesium_polylepis.1
MRSTEEQLSRFIHRPPLALFNSSAAHVWAVDRGQCDCGACEVRTSPRRGALSRPVDCCTPGMRVGDAAQRRARALFVPRAPFVPRAQFYLASTLCCNVNNCGLDLSGRMLGVFAGGASSVKPRVAARPDGLYWVDQWRYMPAGAEPFGNASTLLRWAIVYVPSACEGPNRLTSCRRHVDYHGCTDKCLRRDSSRRLGRPSRPLALARPD